MNRRIGSRLLRICAGGLVCASMVFSTAHATVFVIKFGGSLGTNYSPSSLAVSVGDTIEWQGSFSFHPLASTTVPAGAASFSNSSGTVFDYVVVVPGRYDYVCEVHQPAMAGSFTAALSGIGDTGQRQVPTIFGLGQNYPNPFNPETVIGFGVQGSGERVVRLAVYDLLGREVAVLVNGKRQAGSYEARFDGAEFPSGAYIYRLTIDNNVIGTRKMILMK
jgi:plastocyanin